MLHEISLEVYAGEFVSIIGPNGAGKTTVLRVVSGFLHPHAGSVHERKVRSAAGRRRELAAGWSRTFRRAVSSLPIIPCMTICCWADTGFGKNQGRLRSGQALVYEFYTVLAANREQLM